MEKIDFVYSTTDYSRFKTLSGNRDLNKLNIRRLKESMQKKYLMSPIVVNEKFEIIDGQHRLEAAAALGLPVNFILCSGYNLPEVQMLNSNMKNWTHYDYLESYCSMGYEHYINFRQFMEWFPSFGFRSSATILGNYLAITSHKIKRDKTLISETNKRGDYAINTFYSGEFVIPDFALSVNNAKLIMQIAPYYCGYNRFTFVSAILGCMRSSNYDHSKFIHRLASNPTMMQHCTSITSYRLLIEEIYNYRSRDKVSLRYDK